MDDVSDITIVGAGPTGLFAAFYAGLREMKTNVVESLSEPGGQLAALYPDKYIFDAPGFMKILARDLAKNLYEQAKSVGPKFHFNETVESLETSEDGVMALCTNKGRHLTKTLLITAGVGSFHPHKIGIPEIDQYEGKGLHYVVTEKKQFIDKRILIVGGGDSALDWSQALDSQAKHITLITRRGVFRAHEKSVAAVQSLGIDIFPFSELKEIRGNNSVEEAIIQNNQSGEESVIKIDEILVLIGFKADLGPIKEWGLDLVGRSINVNGKMETNIKAIYAAGDISTQLGSVKLNLIATGFSQGAIAVNAAKKYLVPTAPNFEHSSEKKRNLQ